MQINLTVVLFILFIHWVADFICQTDWQAQNKSKDNNALLTHTGIYSAIWFLPMLYLLPGNVYGALSFVGVTMMCHTVQDYITSRINSKLWTDKEVHWFFVSIGFDQFLHFVQLLVTYQVLTTLT
jgi:predicted membrane-bound dolichyl-phosphate-mannose-protein mannosyltransferase